MAVPLDPSAPASPATEDLEIDLLLEAVYRTRGYDFREYARSSLRRRIWAATQAEKVATISALQERVLHDAEAMERFVLGLAVNVSAMFRDPEFFLAFRRRVVPLLKTYPFIRIWQAGCSMGEEVYSIAILLEEEGLYDRCRIYATDMSEAVLRRAREGVYPVEVMQRYTQNYLQAGGRQPFSDYYTAGYDNVRFNPALRRQVVFAQHNLVTDGAFNEFNVVLCRNVMIYFNRALQDRVHKLLYESLAMFGVLGLGARETLNLTPFRDRYEAIDENEKLYRRVAG